jgi:hypothetical protein
MAQKLGELLQMILDHLIKQRLFGSVAYIGRGSNVWQES